MQQETRHSRRLSAAAPPKRTTHCWRHGACERRRRAATLSRNRRHLRPQPLSKARTCAGGWCGGSLSDGYSSSGKPNTGRPNAIVNALQPSLASGGCVCDQSRYRWVLTMHELLLLLLRRERAHLEASSLRREDLRNQRRPGTSDARAGVG